MNETEWQVLEAYITILRVSSRYSCSIIQFSKIIQGAACISTTPVLREDPNFVPSSPTFPPHDLCLGTEEGSHAVL